MKREEISIKGNDGKEIFTYKWTPDDASKTKAVVQIAHGMAEHAGRYERFAEFLTGKGYAVYANDHRGHGKTAGSLDDVGYFADENGWGLVVDDMKNITDVIKKDFAGLPVFLMGHSMGSFITRTYVFKYPKEIDAFIISGTAGNPGLPGAAGQTVARLIAAVKGKKSKSPFLDKLSFGSFNGAFKPNRTTFDWLSRDNAEVDKYINDPYCGDVFSAGFFYDLLGGIRSIFKKENLEKISKDLPIYIFSGANDPVGNNGKGIIEVAELYKKTGIKDVSYKLYEGARHETLNETNREEVFNDIAEWINSHC